MLGALFFFMCVKYIPIGEAVLIYTTNPLIVVLLAWVFLKEEITKTQVLFILGAFAGIILISDLGGEAQN